MDRRAIVLAVALLCACGACFPTYQSARIEPGFRVDADAMAFSGHRIDANVFGTDYMVTVNSAYGFGRRFEIGAPAGIYFNGGGGDGGGGGTNPVLMPYAKLALGNPQDAVHLAIVAQEPGHFGLLYGLDRGSWEPQAMVAYVASEGGPHGDFAYYSRYDQDNQTLLAAAVGAAFKTPERPAIEVGVLRNSYTNNGSHVTYDVFVRAKLGFLK